MSLNDLKIIAPILKALKAQGYKDATPVQSGAFPRLLEGSDLLGCAQSGTGKTAAFAIPILQQLSMTQGSQKGQKVIRALVIAPTRELALQIGDSFKSYGSNLQQRTAVVFGGVSQIPQERALKKGIDILVATPGRLLDLINQGFIDLSKINFNDLKTQLTFKDGKVNVKPFDLKYQDIKVTIGGSHGFDQAINYDLKFNVPAKYLGNEVNALMAKLTPAESAKLDNIPVNAVMTGSFSKPKISTDMKAAVTNLANQLIQQQKDKLINQGTNALENLIKGNTKDKDTTKAPTKQDEAKEKAKDIINGLFGGKKK